MKQLGTICLTLLLCACASVDFDSPKPESRALTETDDTFLHAQVRDHVALHPGQAGFYPIYDGVDSLALRLLLAERAEKSIDAQYFLIHDDLVGNLFIQSLLAAANRGVRVRFLLDDVLSKGLDPGLATLDSHDNIEVRIFNPFANRRFRALDAPTSLGRITRRMHNKSFTVDNQVTLIGGRNMAAEYFDARTDVRFGDLDVLAIGPTVNEVSDMFDTYWNHRAAVPISRLSAVPENADRALAAYHGKVSASLEEVHASRYADAVRKSLTEFIGTGADAFTWADYDVVFDSPDKVERDTTGTEESILVQMRDTLGEVQDELFVVTAYLVLDEQEIEAFRRARDRGVDITVLTNSLASNNHAAVHASYMNFRKELLEMGVKLFELRAGRTIPADAKLGRSDPVTTLHAKTFAVDRSKIFIGSFNWNQRSVNRDTELGVIIDSDEIAGELVDLVTPALKTAAYEVYLDDGGKLRWRIEEGGRELVLDKEPQTGFWKRFGAGFMRILPIRSQL
jgi:putative cardiolipin synthase